MSPDSFKCVGSRLDDSPQAWCAEFGTKGQRAGKSYSEQPIEQPRDRSPTDAGARQWT